jgi:thiamine-phosphate pyrophosphorylase
MRAPSAWRTPLTAARTLAKQALKLNRTAQLRRDRNTRPLPPLIMITDAKRQGDPLAALAALPRGSMVILHDYDHPERAHLARELAKACRRRRLVLLIAGSPGLAAQIRADGIHLPERLAYRARAARQRHKDWLITVSAHSLPAIRRAESLGADAVLLGPVFPTRSHPGARTLGPRRFAGLAGRSDLPVYALGGISAATAQRLAGTGAVGLAAIDAFAPRSGAAREADRNSLRN